MKLAKLLTQTEVKNIFEFIDGKWYRKQFTNKYGSVRKQKYIDFQVANHVSGYCNVKINGRTERAHRVVYAYFYGDIPSGFSIDHIDGNILNNSINNLRLVTNRENSHNRKVHRDGKCRGVGFHKATGKWRARTDRDASSIAHYLGVFNTREEAIRVRLKWEQMYFGSIQQKAFISVVENCYV